MVVLKMCSTFFVFSKCTKQGGPKVDVLLITFLKSWLKFRAVLTNTGLFRKEKYSTFITDGSIFLYKLCGLLVVFLWFSKNKLKKFAPNTRLHIHILEAVNANEKTTSSFSYLRTLLPQNFL